MVIHPANYHIKKNWEAFELLTGSSEANGFSKAIVYDEFLLQRYFGGDLSDFLRTIKEKIASLV